MDCSTARRAMLEADPAELSPGPRSELSRHLETCPSCAAAAAEILAAERGLASWLAAAQPRGDAAAAVASARTAAERRARRRILGSAGSVLAAAAVAAVLLLPRTEIPQGTPAASAPGEPVAFSVTAPRGRDVVVMHTADPKIVVVWYLPSRRGS